MTPGRNGRLCPVALAGHLDSRLRRWLQNPRKILSPFVRDGMTVLDVGCGPGFFSVAIAHMVGDSGRVIAVDLQPGMLDKLRRKVQGTPLETRITLHLCRENELGVTGPIDFILLFYVVHEVTDQAALFLEIARIVKPGGKIFIVEPPLHVSRAAFEKILLGAGDAGLMVVERPKVFLSKAAVLTKP